MKHKLEKRYREIPLFYVTYSGISGVMKITLGRMHKINGNCISDTTVIFLYVHKIST